MTTCTRIDDLLLDGSPAAMETAARHARECPVCADSLTSWEEIGLVARSMRQEWNNDLLWPRIERALRAEALPRSNRAWQFAAAVVMTVALGSTMFYAVRMQNREADFDRKILRVSALDRVEAAEKEHLDAIQELESLASTTLENSSEPLLVSYKEKLMLLDDAIAECEQLIRQNRQNGHLRRQLLAMYSAKQTTLEQVLREETHAAQR